MTEPTAPLRQITIKGQRRKPGPRKKKRVRPKTQLREKKAKGLNVRERAFVTAYLSGPPGIRGIAIKSAEAAGYSARNDASGHRLLAIPKVRAAIDQHLRQQGIRTDRILAEMAKIGFSDLRTFVEWTGTTVTLKPSKDLSDLEAAAVAEVSQAGNGGLKFKLHDKVAALTMLGKQAGLFRTEISGPGGGPIPLDHSVRFYLPDNGRDKGEVVEAEEAQLVPVAHLSPEQTDRPVVFVGLPDNGRPE